MKRFAAVLVAVPSVAIALALPACGRSSLDPLPYPPTLDASFDAAPDVGRPDARHDAAPTGCTTDKDCKDPAAPYCDVSTGHCVPCLTDGECPAGEACHDHECLSLCGAGDSCGTNFTCCGMFCVDLVDDSNNCGACGKVCGSGLSCIASQCQSAMGCHGGPTCSEGLACCADGCTNTLTDPKNCDACGRACMTGDVCVEGVCQATGDCNGGPPCTGTQTCCAGGCTETSTDPYNCDGCGKVCPPDETCSGSACHAAAQCNGGPACTPPKQCCAEGCDDTSSDPNNCEHCGEVCPAGDTCVSGKCTPPASCDGGPACKPGFTCCPAGCVDTGSDAKNCGGCGVPCLAPGVCEDGACVTSEGSLDPTVNPTYLAPGAHNYTSIYIPAGVTVYVAGGGAASGTLELYATGDITVDGVIDVSGGPGTQNTITSESTETGSAGSGGYAGEPYQSAAPSAACGYVSGNPGLLGFAAEGTAGGCAVFTGCAFMYSGPQVFTAILAGYGGGAGVFSGYRAYGSGGGGPAGGAPGALGAAYSGEDDCAGAAGAGGALNGQGGSGGGPPYDGSPGISGATQCPGVKPSVPPAYVGGGGGGSIGVFAVADLAVASTFQTGSGGGGGSADYLNRPEFGGSSGGGGGGGALRLSTPGTISIAGRLLAEGGRGGDAFIGTGSITGCNPQPGAGGGGGSGGVIFLSAPTITVSPGAVVSTAGGAGGAESEFATGGGGGAGGLGRVRVSVDASTCTLGGSFTPPLDSGCSPAGKAGKTYVGVYPN